MGLVVVTPPLAGGAQTEHFTVELFWTRCPASSSAPVEVLSAFSYSPTGSSSASGLGSVPKGVTATMPVNAESVSVMPQDLFNNEVEPKVCVAFYPAATKDTTKPLFYYGFTNALIMSYVLQDEAGTGASVQITFSYQKVVIDYFSAG